MKKTLILLFFMVLIPARSSAADDLKSEVAIKLDQSSCNYPADKFISLNTTFGNLPLTVEKIESWINERAGIKCKIDGFLLAEAITEETLLKVKTVLSLLEKRKNPSRIPAMWLDSQGGVIIQAMNIGDLIAQKNIDSYILLDGKCLSACVFIYAAAETRSGAGQLGIHRPFSYELAIKNKNYGEYLKDYEELTLLMKTYLSKYGVSPELVDQMNVISSDKIKILNSQDRANYGLGYLNIAAQEFDKARTIKICGKEIYEESVSYFNEVEACEKKRSAQKIAGTENWCFDIANNDYPGFQKTFQNCKLLKEQYSDTAK